MKSKSSKPASGASVSVLVSSCFFFAATAYADPLGAGTGRIYRMAPDASYQEGCFPPCLCPVMMEEEVLGTAKFTYAGFSNAVHTYLVNDVNWLTLGSNSQRRITGSGKYYIGTPGPMTVIQQRLELTLAVDDSPPAHFDSGWVPYGDANNSGIEITVSLNGIYCWDRVIRVHLGPVPPAEYRRYSLDTGSTFQRGCIDGLCDCAVGPELPMRGEFALVPLQQNPLFQRFAVVDANFRVMTPNASDGIPISGYGLYWVGGEVAIQHRLMMALRVAGEDSQRYDSGQVSGGGQFPLIDIITRTHTNCVDTILHIIASPDSNGGDVCGGIMGIGCPTGAFCQLPPGHCCCDFQGVCQQIPSTCPEYYDPVCGCDGITYSNPCFAGMAGQSIDYWGPCSNSCASNADCAEGHFCKFNPGTCGMTNSLGVCMPRPGACPDVWDPVCGCDGITYGNECEAYAAGASIRHDGICDDPCRPTPDGFSCTSCFSPIPEEVCRASVLHLDVHSGAVTNRDCDCMNMSDCHIEFGNASPHAEGNCPPGQTCEVVRRDTDNDGLDDTFWARCMASHEGPCCFDIDDGPIRYDTCLPRTEAACEAEGGIFAGTNTGCDAAQACYISNDASLCADLHPVCCMASNGQPGGPGTSCGEEVCGGIQGIPCDSPNEFCRLPIGHCCCDHFGVCTPTGGDCTAEWDPVCGCDGQTYSNECTAYSEGVSVHHLGACGQPPCSATRVMEDTTHCAGLALQVRILLAPPSSTVAIAMEDSPPPGWTVSGISDGGFYDAANNKVKWGPFFKPFPPQVSYFVTPTFNSAAATCFHGVVSLDGINQAICGNSCLPPCCPRMTADTAHGGCGSCPVADCNSCDASICGDASIHMCEVVGYACSWLHGCHDDLAGMTRAAYIWRTGECYCWDADAGNWYPADCAATPGSGCCDASAIAGSQGGLIDARWMALDTARGRTRGNAPLQVWVDLDIASTASAVALEVSVPPGWKVTGITDGGVWDADARKVKWGVFFDDLSRTVGFTAHAPSKTTTLRNGLLSLTPPARWNGTVSVDGINHRITAR